MRILHVLDHSVPLHSGYAFRTLSIVNEQKKRGWEPYLLTSPKQESGAVLEEEAEGWRFLRTPYTPGRVAKLPVAGEVAMMRALEQRLRTAVDEIRPDIIHAHSPVLNGLPALRVARHFDLPLVYEVRAFWEDAAAEQGTSPAGGLRYRATRAAETFVLRRATAVTTICNGLRDAITARGIASDKVTVIPNAVNLDHFKQSPAADAELRQSLGLDGCAVLGFAGSFFNFEGLDVLVRALPLIRAENDAVKLLLIGGGEQEKQLQALVGELGLNESVVFTGRVPHQDMPRYYGLIDLLVYPRLGHRLTELVTPLKPLEAMAQDKLVAASDVGGHRELIRDGETGFLFEAESPEALAQRALSVLAMSAQEGDAIRRAARRYVETERNWPVSVANYEAVYAGCVAGVRTAQSRRQASP